MFIKPLGYVLIGFGLALLSHILLVTLQNPPFIWQGLLTDAAALALVIGLLMLVAIPFAGLRQLGSAFLVLGIAAAMISDAEILSPDILLRLGTVVVTIAGGYLLVLKGHQTQS